MYVVYHLFKGEQSLLLAASTRLALQVDGATPGVRLGNLLVFRLVAATTPREIVLRRGSDEVVGRMRWAGERLEVVSATTSVIGTLVVYKAHTLVQSGNTYALLSRVWRGAHMISPTPLQTPGSRERRKRRITGWSTTGQIAAVQAAAVATPDHLGYLVWGGDAGLRIGGEHGFSSPPLFFTGERELPQQAARALFSGPPG